jgi:dipeptidyl aminopeptidase/acylaminoacyl peptidase
MKQLLLLLMLVATCVHAAFAQDAMGYQMPPQDIIDLIDAPPTPGVLLSPNNRWLLLLERSSYPGIDEVAQEELRLAGLRINPRNFGPSRQDHVQGISVRPLETDVKPTPVQGLPERARLNAFRWSPDGSLLAFTHATDQGISLWVLDVARGQARRLTEEVLNNVMPGSPFEWLPDNQTIVYRARLGGTPPVAPATPAGPVVQSNSGQAAPVRTYQDLLRNPHDEALFDHYGQAELKSVSLKTGKHQSLNIRGLISSVSASPVNGYLLVQRLKRPFSYLVPYSRFPRTVDVFDRSGKIVRTVAELPLTENLPKGFDAVPTGPRYFAWAPDAPEYLYWLEAQDGGDPRQEAEFRDKIFFLAAPFSGSPMEGPALKLRFSDISWTAANREVVIAERWWSNRREIVSRYALQPGATAKVLFDRSYEDRYNDPGQFATHTNAYGRPVLLASADGSKWYLDGMGASPEGNRPFLDEYDLATGKSTRLWRSEAPYYELPIEWIDVEKGWVLTRRESVEEPPNYYRRNLRTGELKAVTDFPHPYPSLKGVSKEMVRYSRADSIELTGNLYLPAGYNREKDGPLPVFMWAYPREFKSADAASQVANSPYEFTRISWGSPLYWVTQGYAVFDNFAMPILGEGDAEPNETFVEQLRMNAESAINHLVGMGVADRSRIGVGGHSYGAFMTANLMAHTDLFAAGIARSGAYNRTLTPFGFQSEERTYWEAPEVYNKMSPFSYADRIKEPLLLIHGEVDNNSGTFPIQSERFYAALKGHGATTRLVMLPHESHGYRARESVLHTLWEMNQWLDTHVKNRPMARP